MSDESATSIRLLEIYKNDSTIRLKVLRLGSEIIRGEPPIKIQKLIMVDEEGSQIGLVMFGAEVETFSKEFENNKTYVIKDAAVKKVNPSFPSAHPEKELVLTKNSTVVEALESIETNIIYNFIDFKEIVQKHKTREFFDVYGIVTKVDAAKTLPNQPTKYLREITIMDNQYKEVKVTLWEDMANNEGCELQQMKAERPVIAIQRAMTKEYQGLIHLQTTGATTLQLNPHSAEVEELRRWLCNIEDPIEVCKLTMTERFKSAKPITLEELITRREELPKDTCYSFIATVYKVENEAKIWYESCINCTTSAAKKHGSIECSNCKDGTTETTPRYVIKLNVVQGHQSATITLFGETASIFVGCSIQDYIKSIDKEGNSSKFYRGLSLQASNEIRFMIALSRNTTITNGKLNAIAEAIEKLNPVKKEDEKHQAPSSTTQERIIKKVEGKRKKQSTKKEAPELIYIEVEGKRNKRNTKPEPQDYIEIASDDEETLNEVMKKIRNKKGRQTKMIKKEKE